MRRLVFLGLLAISALSATAAMDGPDTRITVAQLEQALKAANASHEKDAAIARQIGGMELTERLTDATLARLSANLKAGSKAALALHMLADQSAFLDPPASELLATPAPDNATQHQMIDAARNYVAQTLLQLPNFLATRTDNRFDNSHLSIEKDPGPHRVGTSSREISMRNDRENATTDHLDSWGEFGSAVAVVLLNDTAHGTVTWSHWEQTAAGPAAAFHYSVPKAASHFEIYIPVLNRLAPINIDPDPRDFMRRFGVPDASLSYDPKIKSPHPSSAMRAKPGYSGSILLDPSTGTVLRITMESDPNDIAPYQRAAMMVQYGPVKVGESRFTCPRRSLSSTSLTTKAAKALFESAPSGSALPTEWLNETLFTGYHHFKSTARILSGAEAPH